MLQLYLAQNAYKKTRKQNYLGIVLLSLQLTPDSQIATSLMVCMPLEIDPATQKGAPMSYLVRERRASVLQLLYLLSFFCGISKSLLLMCVMLFNKIIILSIKAISELIRETFILYQMMNKKCLESLSVELKDF